MGERYSYGLGAMGSCWVAIESGTPLVALQAAVGIRLRRSHRPA
jgi:hypothetical protein